ncbi:hypothetical protein F383_25398 [Gossypium arboreum]|uniref:Uncharacterized protein n=1 Tax=Gossypium arboreum TaxID=29729 RepID=A0A0B0MUF7_GOSAR|nr:hypothetical protein F383_25398 [Gossypium arboreum]
MKINVTGYPLMVHMYMPRVRISLAGHNHFHHPPFLPHPNTHLFFPFPFLSILKRLLVEDPFSFLIFVLIRDKDIGPVSVQKMGKCKGCGKLGRMLPRDGPVNAYYSSLLCSPVVSVWDCIVRKMRYSYRPEWV